MFTDRGDTTAGAERVSPGVLSHHQVSSVAQSWLTLCDPMDRSTPGLPVHHHLPELAQTHVHRVTDAIQPSHPLSSLPLPPSIFPSIRVFCNESVLRIRWPKHWSFSFNISPANEYSGPLISDACLLSVRLRLSHKPTRPWQAATHV